MITIRNLALGLLCLYAVAIVSCTSASEIRPELAENGHLDFWISLDRTFCEGTCPAYSVEVHGDGQVIYDGRGHVAVQGPASGQVDQTQIQDIVNALNEIDFFGLPHFEEQTISSQATATITVEINGQSHQVRHYLGDEQAPQALDELAELIDQITNVSQWTGK